MPRLPFAAVAALLAAAAAPAAEPVAPAFPGPLPLPVSVDYDVTFAVAGTGKLQLDLAAPKTGGPYPCVVCLHGGAWKYGSRRDLSGSGAWEGYGYPGQSLIEMIARRGFVAASVSYRLAPQNKFPTQIQDVKTAVRFLRANAKRFNLDPDRIGALGFSAGGHLAALLGTADDVPEFEGELYPKESSRVRCVVDFFGPADLTLYCETPGIDRAYFAPLFGGPGKDKLDLYRKASPIEHVSKGDAAFLIIHGTADVVVPVIHSERLHDRLVKAGVKAEFLPVKGKGHGWGGAEAGETMEAAVRFLTAELKGK